MTPTASQNLSLNLKRIIRAPRERVFAAFASIEELKNWFGPDACHVKSGAMEFEKDGTYRLRMFTTEYGEADLVGTYREVTPPSRLAFSWEWQGPAEMNWGNMEVEIDFAEVSGGTEISITHRGLASPEVCEGHRYGWEGSFDKLDNTL